MKLIATPIYMSRGHVNFRVLKFLALGGLPAVIIGSFVLNSLDQKALSRPVLLIVGLTVLTTAAGTLWRSLTPQIASKPVALKWLPWIVAPIGFEVGFSSAGAGALGTIVLMRFTSMIPAEVVGTDSGVPDSPAFDLHAGGIHASMTGVPWGILGKLLLGGVPAVLIGTQLISVVSPRKMRLVLCLWLVYIGGQLSWRGIVGSQDSKPAAAVVLQKKP